MDGRTVKDYASGLRALSRQMENARPARNRRDEVFLLTDIGTGEPADLNETPYRIFYDNGQQWALAMTAANPAVGKIAAVIESAINERERQDEN